MQFIWEGIIGAGRLIFSLDPEVYEILLFTIQVSIFGTLLSALIGVPIGFWVAISEFKGRPLFVTLLNTLMSLPTVVVGLLVYAFLSRQGPLGSLGLIFTPAAVIIGQCILASPIIAALTLSAVNSLDPRVALTARALGADSLQAAWTIFTEARFALMAAIIAGFGRVIAEVGAAMMLGGNIKGYTRTLTTAIALETSKGEFGFGLALGLILLAMALAVNAILYRLQRVER